MALEFWFVVYDVFQSRRWVAVFWNGVLPAWTGRSQYESL